MQKLTGTDADPNSPSPEPDLSSKTVSSLHSEEVAAVIAPANHFARFSNRSEAGSLCSLLKTL